MGTPSSSSSRSWLTDLGWLALLCAVLYGAALGRAPLDNPDEGRYAEIPREMIAAHDWVTPRLDGVNYFEKPPLVYWTVAASFQIFGQNEWAARLTPALFGLGGVLLTYAAARRRFGRLAGRLSGVVLATSLLYAGVARFLVLDMAVSVLMAATLFCFILGVQEPPGWKRRWLFWGLYASAALATLSKGLIGFLLTGFVMLLWLLLFNQWKRLRPLHLPTGIVLFLAIAAPWHVLVAERNATWAHFYFIHEHWERFTTKEHGRYQPPYYFIPIVIGGLFPWIGFLVRSVRDSLRDERSFLLVWAAAIFLFFSLSDSKLPAYILPIFPALAVLIGVSLADVWGGNQAAAARNGIVIFAILAALIAAAALFAVFDAARVGLPPDRAGPLRPYAVAVAAVLIAGAWAAVRSLGRGNARTPIAAAALTAGVVVVLVGLATRFLYRPDTKPLALWVRAHAEPDSQVYHYHGFFHDFTFYAARTVDLVDFTGELEPQNDPAAVAAGRFATGPQFFAAWEGSRPVYVVSRDSELHSLFAHRDFRYRLIARAGGFSLLENR